MANDFYEMLNLICQFPDLHELVSYSKQENFLNDVTQLGYVVVLPQPPF